MDERQLNKAIEHAKIKAIEDLIDHVQHRCFESHIYVAPEKVTDYEYTIHIGHLNTKDMIAFMNWFREVKSDWLEGLEQGYDDGWSRN
jgi:hypothetical protein